MEEISNQDELLEILTKFDQVFDHSLTGDGINLRDFSKKLMSKAYTYGIFKENNIAAFVSLYANDHKSKTAYIALLAVLPDYQQNSMGSQLLEGAIQKATSVGMKEIKLEVEKDNNKAISLYQKNNFVNSDDYSNKTCLMSRQLE